MAITMGRDDTGAYTITDSSTGEVRRYEDQPSWLRASLIELLRGAERVEEGLERLQGLYERTTHETETTAAQPAA
jgi:hypothetical protein